VKRNKALAAAALAALLAPACKRAAEPAREPAQSGSLAAPAPSAATVTSPLSKGTTAYTNEQQAEYIHEQAAKMGIGRITNSTPLATDSDAPLPQITEEEGIERTRALAHALAVQRRAIDRNKPDTVELPSATPKLLETPKDEPAAGTPSPQGP